MRYQGLIWVIHVAALCLCLSAMKGDAPFYLGWPVGCLCPSALKGECRFFCRWDSAYCSPNNSAYCSAILPFNRLRAAGRLGRSGCLWLCLSHFDRRLGVCRCGLWTENILDWGVAPANVDAVVYTYMATDVPLFGLWDGHRAAGVDAVEEAQTCQC